MKKKNKGVNYDLMSKDPDNWKGIFYFNPKDPRVIVPKINPNMGMTLNFGHVYTYLGLIAIILVIVAAKYFF